MAKSEKFGQLVRDILGSDSLHVAARKTGLSANLVSQMRNDHVPGARVIAKFSEGYQLSEKRRAALLAAAQTLREDLNPDIMLAMAADLAGLDTEARLELLEMFRELQNRTRKRAA